MIAICVLSICFLCMSQSYASDSLLVNEQNHGWFNVDKFMKPISTQSAEISSEAITQASDVQYVGGGEFWVSWGADRFTSNYYHETKWHKTTAENGNGSQVTSGWVNPDYTARATIKATVSGNKAYWDTRD